MPARFWLFFSARTVSVLGNAFGPIALAFGVLALPGTTPTTLGVVLAAQGVPQLGLLLLGGVVGDRFSRYRVLVSAELLSGTAYAGLAAMILTGWAPIVMLCAAAFVAGAASALLLPSLTGAVVETVPGDSLQKANGLLRLGTNSARISGVVAAGATVAWLGPGVALAFDAATYLVAAGLLSALRLPASVRANRRDLRGDLRVGWREFASRPWLWSTVAAAGVINAASTAALGVLGPVLARDRLGGAMAWSLVLAGYAAGMLVGVAVAIKFKPRRPLPVAILFTPALALPLLALGFVAPLPLVVLAAFGAGIAMDIFGVLWDTIMQTEVPADALSRVSSYEYLVSSSLKPAGALVAGHVAVQFGPAVGLLLFGGLMLLAAAGALAHPAVRHHPPRPHPGVQS
ncbi:major facilitator superfamily MFS_1 [Kribbella flavida DSM 17836]|uniref:Major facilitator superfamily MFS_1 n=1 Tax=Kribbella flavida (strain DSM 17836 / JCM 10339 / NBRC 14399) TaxID=479435 RepID=D2PYS3_KRIFD|nr:major facilitator superfamily MFS_1 [Kribbella flavida DSM 17836]